jgi:formyl-CoA transferase
MRVPAGLGDTASGIHAVVGILAALLQRHTTGVGQRIEIAQQDVVVNLRRVYFSDYYQSGRPGPRAGNRSATAAPSNVYRCRPFGANDYVFLHANTPEMWRALTRVIGRAELADDPRYGTLTSRVQRVDEVDALVERWTETHTKQEAMELLAAAGVPCGAVLDSVEVMTNQHLIERGMIVDVEHPVRGKFRMPGHAIRMSDSPTRVTRAPLVGEHNQEVFGKLAGLSLDELSSLAADGVI